MLSFHELAAGTAEPPPASVRGTDLAQIVYTGGTESLPKGAMLTHDAVIWRKAIYRLPGVAVIGLPHPRWIAG